MAWILDGITNLVLGLTRSHGQGRSWAHAFQGVVGILAGGLTFLWPGVTALALVYFIGAWAIVTGTFEIIAAIRLRRYIKGEGLLMLSGAMSLLYGGLWSRFLVSGQSASRGSSGSTRLRPVSS